MWQKHSLCLWTMRATSGIARSDACAYLIINNNRGNFLSPGKMCQNILDCDCIPTRITAKMSNYYWPISDILHFFFEWRKYYTHQKYNMIKDFRREIFRRLITAYLHFVLLIIMLDKWSRTFAQSNDTLSLEHKPKKKYVSVHVPAQRSVFS